MIRYTRAENIELLDEEEKDKIAKGLSKVGKVALHELSEDELSEVLDADDYA
jgi:hypothetical protein